MIPAQNVVEIRKKQKWKRDSYYTGLGLLERFRNKELTIEDMTPRQRFIVQDLIAQEYLRNYDRE